MFAKVLPCFYILLNLCDFVSLSSSFISVKFKTAIKNRYYSFKLLNCQDKYKVTEFKILLLKGLQAKSIKDLNINVSGQQALLMELHAKELMLWNKKINLTAIKQPMQIAEKHFIDSLAAASFVKNKNSIIGKSISRSLVSYLGWEK